MSKLKQGLIEERIAEWYGEQSSQAEESVPRLDAAHKSLSAQQITERKKKHRRSLKFWSSKSKSRPTLSEPALSKSGSKSSGSDKAKRSDNVPRSSEKLGLTYADVNAAQKLVAGAEKREPPCLVPSDGRYIIRVRYDEKRYFKGKVDEVSTAHDVCVLAQRRFQLERRIFSLYIVQNGEGMMLTYMVINK